MFEWLWPWGRAVRRVNRVTGIGVQGLGIALSESHHSKKSPLKVRLRSFPFFVFAVQALYSAFFVGLI